MDYLRLHGCLSELPRCNNRMEHKAAIPLRTRQELSMKAVRDPTTRTQPIDLGPQLFRCQKTAPCPFRDNSQARKDCNLFRCRRISAGTSAVYMGMARALQVFPKVETRGCTLASEVHQPLSSQPLKPVFVLAKA